MSERVLKIMPNPREEEFLRERREEAQRRYRERDEQARAVFDQRLCRPEQEKLKTLVLGAKTLCALLMGPTGIGKTSSALFLTRHVRGHWMRATELATAERQHELGRGLPPAIERAREAVVTVIDDVGHEKDTGALYDVLSHRYENGKPTIVTTGLTQAQLTEHISAAGVRRIVDQHCPLPNDGGEMQVLIIECFGKGSK